MELTSWTRRLALAGSGVAIGLVAIAPLASAQTTPAPVAPITLSPEESQAVCGTWIPKLTTRTTKATERINGGPEIRGSVANLKARAQDQRAKNHNDRATQLDERAKKRSDRLPQLADAKKKLDDFTAAHCKPATGPTK
ncbi:hypothetical protein AB5J62_11365 [Amycolatopsis sp. cg5]|uniref:hypothetical protein n=1 Tax=Amycolatopsis sp. cg5 TaxID=3238802 RepID=UPI0035242633